MPVPTKRPLVRGAPEVKAANATSDLEEAIARTARAVGIQVDSAVYTQAGRDPARPILFAGSLYAPIAFLGRDLGRDEVLRGEPLIGGAGRRVRRAVYVRVTGQPAPADDPYLRPALDVALLTNTVPYKPVGNKAYPQSVRDAMRPHIAELLACRWRGHTVITLGNEAFAWFAPYCEPGAWDAVWQADDRYERALRCRIVAQSDRGMAEREIAVAPLPHPSPLNRRYLAAFPSLLESRLSALG